MNVKHFFHCSFIAILLISFCATSCAFLNESDEDSSQTVPDTSDTEVTTHPGVREISLGQKERGNGITLTATLAPSVANEDYSAIDNYVKGLEIAGNSNISVQDAAILITKTASTDKEKVRAIYTWIANNIDYCRDADFESAYYASGAFKYRTAFCQGFAKLLQEMCSHVGISAQYVSGYGKLNYKSSDSARFTAPASHGWNIVHTSDGDYFVDATWAANDRNSIDKWFFTDPCYFITSHFPKEARFQLLSTAVSIDDFLTLPRIDNDYEKIGLDGKEVLEFVYTHLDAWKPDVAFLITQIPADVKYKVHEIQFSDCIKANEDFSASYYLGEEEFKNPYTSNESGTQSVDFEYDYLKYTIVDSYENGRSDIALWGRPAAYQEPGVFTDPISVKAGKSGGIGSDGSITINGVSVPNSKQIAVVPSGQTATINGTEANAPESNIDQYGTMPEELEADSQFPIGRTVKLSSYSIAERPISMQLYKAVMESVNSPEYDSINRNLPVSMDTVQVDGEWIDYKYVADDSYAQLTFYQAAIFCNALTKLVMSEDECVYSFADIKINTDPNTAASNRAGYSEEVIQAICEHSGISREQIDGIGKYSTPFWGNEYLSAYIASDFTKKGFRLATDAEWEFAARGADQSDSQSWNLKRREVIDSEAQSSIKPMLLGSVNKLGLVDLTLNYCYKNSQKKIWSTPGELVEDELVSNLDFPYRDYKSSDGSVLNPCYKSYINHSARKDVDWRALIYKMEAQGYEVGTVRLARTLD